MEVSFRGWVSRKGVHVEMLTRVPPVSSFPLRQRWTYGPAQEELARDLVGLPIQHPSSEEKGREKG